MNMLLLLNNFEVAHVAHPLSVEHSSAGEDDGFIGVRATSEAAGGLPQQGNGNLVRRR